MIELSGFWDYLGLFGLAAVLGALGGLAYELMQARRGQTGQIEVPRAVPGGRYRDWGLWANMIIGAIAAVAALWVFPPEIRTSVDAAARTVTTTEYDVIKVVGLSLIIGSAGSSFLSAMQARALALVKDQEAKQTRKVAEEQIEAVKRSVESGAPTVEVAARLDSAKTAVTSLRDSGPGNPTFG
jgi:hypothetical protein